MESAVPDERRSRHRRRERDGSRTNAAPLVRRTATSPLRETAPPGHPTIQVLGLEKSYGKLRVLCGVDFEVPRGAVFALLGSNGAGKTTTVRILSTLVRPSGGRAAVNGFDVATEAHRVRESISLTGQFAAVDEVLTGRENLILIGRLRHLTNPKANADELLDRFGLVEAGHQRVCTYSGGMRRLLDIAMSLIADPPVVFLDEPTTGLDPERRLEVWQTIRNLAAEGTTVLLTTQHLEEAEQLADQVAILHQGRILVDGSVEDLKALLPRTKVEYVQKHPSLQDVFLTLVGHQGKDGHHDGDHVGGDVGGDGGGRSSDDHRSLTGD